MDVTPHVPATAQLIQSYGPAGFRIGGIDYASSVLITTHETTSVEVTDLADLTAHHFVRLWQQSEPIDVLLIGTGATHRMLDPTLRQTLKSHQIGVDAMATGAAARTFNVLLSEERRIAALLLIPA